MGRTVKPRECNNELKEAGGRSEQHVGRVGLPLRSRLEFCDDVLLVTPGRSYLTS